MFEGFREKIEKLIASNALNCEFPLERKNPRDIKYLPSHLHKQPFEYAIDIEASMGERISAPINGIVREIKQNSIRWVPESSNGVDPNKYLNWLTIQEIDTKGKLTNRIVQLCHIQAGSAMATVGARIQKGFIIATVGINGVTTVNDEGKPDVHLHIVAGVVDNQNRFQSIPVKFTDRKIPNPYQEIKK